MKNDIIKMSDVVSRSMPDFSIEYELKNNLEIKQFPGCILNFSYDATPSMKKVFCDIFPEFRKNAYSNDVIGPNEFIPSKGKADMWIVSERNRLFHENSIYNGKKCYLMKGNEIVAICTITKAMNHLKKEQYQAKLSS